MERKIELLMNPENLPYAVNGNVMVEWENLDEGICGDYDPDDPNDVNLLRFSVYFGNGSCWEPVDDASYCTEMPADTDIEILNKAVHFLAKEYGEVLNDDPLASVKKLGEALSWIAPDWFKNRNKGKGMAN